MIDWERVYLLYLSITPFFPELDKDTLVYMARRSIGRYSYEQLNKGLSKTDKYFIEEVASWLSGIIKL